MDTQLVSASCKGEEGDAGLALVARNDLIAGEGGFAMERMNHLARAVEGIQAEGEVDDTF